MIDERYRLLQGDCLEVMKALEANSVDTIITDPPYGIFLMEKGWDRGVPGVELWKEVLRVAKPGATLLAFGGTRTFHRLACAIEDAGWEMRDCILWLHGQGFPKSHNISKAIDKAAGAEREVVGAGRGMAHLGVMHDDAWQPGPKELPITRAATGLAKLWEGWGTALKPAWEPIIIAMKPTEGTFAENAERWDVAGLNIEAGRIPASLQDIEGARRPYPKFKPHEFFAAKTERVGECHDMTKGRWPANVVLSHHPECDGSCRVECPVRKLDEQSGFMEPGKYPAKRVSPPGSGRTMNGGWEGNDLGKARKLDGGGASRFFFCAKASKLERGESNTHPTVKPLKLMEHLANLTKTPTGGTVLDPFMGSGTTGIAAIRSGRTFIGIELSPEYYAIAQRRIEAEAATSSP